jgi:hypothetical protein
VILDSIISSIVFEWIGASIKWIFFGLIDLTKKRRPKTLKYYFDGETKKQSDLILIGASNIVLGIVTAVILMLFLIKIL